jgi:hypothetical protein
VALDFRFVQLLFAWHGLVRLCMGPPVPPVNDKAPFA